MHKNPARFQSTLPLRGATRLVNQEESHYVISIHAPLTGSDLSLLLLLSLLRYFNPRSPYGERPRTFFRLPGSYPISIHAPLTGSDKVYTTYENQRTISIHAPLTGSDRVDRYKYRRCLISIHAPLTGSDAVLSRRLGMRVYFNPRSPYGERQMMDGETWLTAEISIHAPLTGSDTPG